MSSYPILSKSLREFLKIYISSFPTGGKVTFGYPTWVFFSIKRGNFISMRKLLPIFSLLKTLTKYKAFLHFFFVDHIFLFFSCKQNKSQTLLRRKYFRSKLNNILPVGLICFSDILVLAIIHQNLLTSMIWEHVYNL